MNYRGIEFSNVFSNISKDYFDFKDFCEADYIGGILIYLQEFLGESFHEFDFILYSQTPGKLNPVFPFGKSKKKEVVFYLSDESSSIPHELLVSGVFAIFKNYLPSNIPFDNLFHFPLGYVNSTPSLQVKPIGERNMNVFFSGALHFARLSFYKHFTKFKSIPDKIWVRIYKYLYTKLVFDNYFPSSFIRFNKLGFKSGLTPDSYAELLYDSKIIICPRGVISYETFRHFEAMRAGCVIISESLPDTFFYTKSPIIFIEDWSKLDFIVERLLADPSELIRIHQKTLNWWEQVCSEKAVARYIAGKIEFLLN